MPTAHVGDILRRLAFGVGLRSVIAGLEVPVYVGDPATVPAFLALLLDGTHIGAMLWPDQSFVVTDGPDFLKSARMRNRVVWLLQDILM